MNIQANEENSSTKPQNPEPSFTVEMSRMAGHWLGFLALPFALASMFFCTVANLDVPKFRSSFDGIVNAKFVESGPWNVAGDEMAEAESRHGDWIRVRTNDGILVWLPASEVQVVFPAHGLMIGNRKAESVATIAPEHQKAKVSCSRPA